MEQRNLNNQRQKLENKFFRVGNHLEMERHYMQLEEEEDHIGGEAALPLVIIPGVSQEEDQDIQWKEVQDAQITVN